MFLLAARFSHPERLILCVLILAHTGTYLAATANTTFTGTKPGCQSQCGNLTVPYPFGIGVGSGCSMISHVFDINCTVFGNTTKAFLDSGKLEILDISETQVRKRITVSYKCYDATGNITSNQTAWTQLGNGQRFTFSQTANKFTVVGCDDTALFSEKDGDNKFIGGCITSCLEEKDVRAGPCNGLGCSQISFPEGLKSFSAELVSQRKHVNVSGFDSCGYAFLGEEARFNFSGSVDLRKDPGSFIAEIQETVPVVIEWTVGDGNCAEAYSSKATYACQDNTSCVDFEPGQGYRCSCLDGYEGNPYLAPGCTDINECASRDTNNCAEAALCTNTPGSYNCSCPDGQIGDGLLHGFGCIKGHTKPPTKIIVGAVLGGSIGMIVILLIFYWLYRTFRRRREVMQKAKHYEQNGDLLLDQRIGNEAMEVTRVFSSDELEKATDHFNADRILGQGGQGTVYKGMLADGKIVAIKKSRKVDENQREQFINEVYIMSQINHRNIVKLLGCCLETEVPLLVYEFIPNGTLYHHIHYPSDEFHITWEMRLQIATDSAAALAYLHSDSSSLIYHRDIKSANILLDEKYRAKVSDFGTSRSILIDQTHVTTRVIGTAGYLDPEYHQSNQYTEKSDVYSFGVVLVELITGQKVNLPPGSQRNASLASLFLSSIKNSSILDIVDPGVLKEGRKEEILLVADLAKRCLNLDGKQRPTMMDVATELKAAMSHDGALSYHQKLPQAQTNLKEIVILENSYNDLSTTSTNSTGIISSKPIDTHPLLFDTTENSGSSFL